MPFSVSKDNILSKVFKIHTANLYKLNKVVKIHTNSIDSVNYSHYNNIINKMCYELYQLK
nr:MAG TPA: hypothetical protein [Bacteriophage sp.]